MANHITREHLDAIRARFADGSSHPDDLRDLLNEYEELRTENNRLHAGITTALNLLDNSDSTLSQNATEALEEATELRRELHDARERILDLEDQKWAR